MHAFIFIKALTLPQGIPMRVTRRRWVSQLPRSVYMQVAVAATHLSTDQFSLNGQTCGYAIIGSNNSSSGALQHTMLTHREKKHENANNFEKWAQKRGRNNADYCTRSGKLLCLPATGVLCANNMLHMHYCSQTDMQYAPKRLKSLCSLRISSLMHLYLYTFMEPKL